MKSKSMALALLCVVLLPGLSGCSVGGTVGDLLPQWAGGLPKDVPPRPGTPEYEEFRRRLEEPQPTPPAESEAEPAAAEQTRKSAR